MTPQRIGSTALLGAFAAAGIVLAHILAYSVAFPSASMRAAVLRTTGHSYLGPAAVIATVALIFGAIGAGAAGFHEIRRGRSLVPSWRYAAVRITVAQAAGFVVLEIAERIVAGTRPVALDVTLIGVGIALQAALGLVAATVLRLLHRAGRATARAWNRVAPARVPIARHVVALLDVAPPRIVLSGAPPARGPPVSPL